MNTSMKNWNRTPATCFEAVFPFIQSILHFLFCPFIFCTCFSYLFLSCASWYNLLHQSYQFLSIIMPFDTIVSMLAKQVWTCCPSWINMLKFGFRYNLDWIVQSSQSKSIYLNTVCTIFLLGDCIIHTWKNLNIPKSSNFKNFYILVWMLHKS